MDVLIDVVALLMGVIGLLGCFLPVLPGNYSKCNKYI